MRLLIHSFQVQKNEEKEEQGKSSLRAVKIPQLSQLNIHHKIAFNLLIHSRLIITAFNKNESLFAFLPFGSSILTSLFFI